MKTHFNPQHATAMSPPAAAPAPLRGAIGISETPTRLMAQEKAKGETSFIQRFFNFFSEFLASLLRCLRGEPAKLKRTPYAILNERAAEIITQHTQTGKFLSLGHACDAAVIIAVKNVSTVLSSWSGIIGDYPLNNFRERATLRARHALGNLDLPENTEVSIRTIFVKIRDSQDGKQTVSYRIFDTTTTGREGEAPRKTGETDVVDASPKEALRVLHERCYGDTELLRPMFLGLKRDAVTKAYLGS